MRVIVTGAGGLVGRAVVAHYAKEGEDVLALDRGALDIASEPDVNIVFDREHPDVVINCGAWTDVDACELDPNRAESVNSYGPELLALACRRLKALFITISTDYVFDGEKEDFYTQRDQPNPLSVYGLSKLAGEQRAQAAWARTIIVRTGYIFGIGGRNFLSTVLVRGQRGERLQVINDCFGTPTYADDLARRLRELAQIDLPGMYHVVNSGAGATFEGFARKVFEAGKLDAGLLETISSKSLKRPAARPRNSRLRCLLSEAIGLRPLPAWQAAVDDFISRQSSAIGADATYSIG